MPFEVRMPQLGMAQESGVIVAWLKAQGDLVATGDALFEVETDKATMEVEAAADGFLAGLRAGEGDDVPVGDVIAVIVETEAELADHATIAQTMAKPATEEPPTAVTTPTTTEEKAAPAEAQPTAAMAKVPMPKPAAGKVLASPKAKRLAAERGIDLGVLRAQGAAEPIHAAVLNTATAGGQSSLMAHADGTAFRALLERADDNADRTMLIAAFAAGAWRALSDAANVAVLIRNLDGSADLIANPDRGGVGAAEAAALSLVDLCDTMLSSYAAAGGGPTLAVARVEGDFAMTLSFSEAALPMTQAAALLNEIAARVAEPIRQLL